MSLGLKETKEQKYRGIATDAMSFESDMDDDNTKRNHLHSIDRTSEKNQFGDRIRNEYRISVIK
jgi:hypothetical protein